MAVPLTRYSKIRNNYCISYFGNSHEYVVQLLLLRTKMQEAFPGINIYIGCKDELIDITSAHSNMMYLKNIKLQKLNFAHIFEIKCNTKEHPVESLVKDLEIDPMITDTSTTPTKLCVICPKAHGYPTKSLSEQEINNVSRFVQSQGYTVAINQNIEAAGWVVGVENIQLFDAAARGIKTTLIPTGLGTALYKSMFPAGEVLNMRHI